MKIGKTNINVKECAKLTKAQFTKIFSKTFPDPDDAYDQIQKAAGKGKKSKKDKK